MPMIRVSTEYFDEINKIAEKTHRSKIGVIGLLLEKFAKEFQN